MSQPVIVKVTNVWSYISLSFFKSINHSWLIDRFDEIQHNFSTFKVVCTMYFHEKIIISGTKAFFSTNTLQSWSAGFGGWYI